MPDDETPPGIPLMDDGKGVWTDYPEDASGMDPEAMWSWETEYDPEIRAELTAAFERGEITTAAEAMNLGRVLTLRKQRMTYGTDPTFTEKWNEAAAAAADKLIEEFAHGEGTEEEFNEVVRGVALRLADEFGIDPERVVDTFVSAVHRMLTQPSEGRAYSAGPLPDRHDQPASGESWEHYDERAVEHMSTFRAAELEAPIQALDTHLDYWSWCATAAHLETTSSFLESYYHLNRVPPAFTEMFANTEAQCVYEALTHYVDPDVAEVVRQLGQAMPPDMLLETDIPVRSGFVVLGKVWDYMTLHAGTYVGHIPVRAIGWSVGPVGQPSTKRGPREPTGVDEEGQATSASGEKIGTKPGIYVYLYADGESLLWERVTTIDLPSS